MKVLFLLFLSSLFFLNSIYAGEVNTTTSTLSASLFPSALPEQNISERWLQEMGIDGNRSKAYYVKRTPEDVKNYYENIYGNVSRDREREYIWVIESMSRGEARESSGTAEAAYVRVYSRPPAENPYINRAFTELENSYMARFSNLSTRDKTRRRNDEELQSVLRQYEYLKRVYFPKTGQTRTTNSGETVYKGLEEVLYDRFFADSDMIRTMRLQEYIEQYTALVSEGRFDEAAKISERIDALSKASTNPTDLWNHAINYLEELRKLAYPTLLVIDKHPSEW